MSLLLYKFLNFFKKHKRFAIVLLFGIFLGRGIFGVPNQAQAAFPALIAVGSILAGLFATGAAAKVGEWVVRAINSFLGICIDLAGKVLIFAVEQLISVAQYNEFINSLTVANGWVIVRDLANMFFIIVLLIVAFGTILGQEQFHYKKILPKFLVMAVLINFSRTIAGLLIDFGQVIMLTFVNGFQAAAAGNFVNAFGIDKVRSLQSQSWGTVGEGAKAEGITLAAQMTGALMMGLIMLLVALFVVFTMLLVLIYRIVYLWLLIVLSPIAWLAGVFPQGEKYYARWWEQFRDQILVGPAMAFFLWLTLLTIGSGSAARQVVPIGPTIADSQVAISELTSYENILTFMVSCVMMLAAVEMSQELGSATAGAIGQTKAFARKALGTAWRYGAKPASKWALRHVDDAQANGQQMLAKSPLGKVFDLFGKRGSAIRAKLQEHGIAMRTVPAAWKLRNERVEKERLGESLEVAYDVLNRVLPSRKDTDYVEMHFGSDVAKKMQEYAAGGDDKGVLLGRLKDQLDSSGKVKKGSEKDALAIMTLLTKNHDFNEVLKDEDLIKKYGLSGEGNDETSAMKAVLGMFGDNHEGLRAMERIGNTGMSNNDTWLYHLAYKDGKGHYKKTAYKKDTLGNDVVDKEAHGKEVAAFVAKRTPRDGIQKTRAQDLLKEKTDKQGNRTFDGLTDTGKEIIKSNISAWSDHFGYIQGELRNALSANLESLQELYQSSDLNAEQRTNLGKMIGFLTTGEPKAKGPAPDEDRIAIAVGARDETNNEMIRARGAPVNPMVFPSATAPSKNGLLGSMIGKSGRHIAEQLQNAASAQGVVPATATALNTARTEVSNNSDVASLVGQLSESIRKAGNKAEMDRAISEFNNLITSLPAAIQGSLSVLSNSFATRIAAGGAGVTSAAVMGDAAVQTGIRTTVQQASNAIQAAVAGLGAYTDALKSVKPVIDAASNVRVAAHARLP